MNRDEFYTAFKHDIITSKLKPGELLKEKQIMQDYGIGRLPMREIMVRLQQENLIETIPRMGTVVTRLDIKHMRDVVELRLELECVVALFKPHRRWLENPRAHVQQPVSIEWWTRLRWVVI